jgi:ABC-type multidrug transport system ATPase subunit
VLTDPPLMFCDEPTSGLDSFMAQNVVLVLKSMALKGKTVVTTIHQPSSEIFAMFDKVLLMAEGRVAFLGSSDDACKFFRA